MQDATVDIQALRGAVGLELDGVAIMHWVFSVDAVVERGCHQVLKLCDFIVFFIIITLLEELFVLWKLEFVRKVVFFPESALGQPSGEGSLR